MKDNQWWKMRSGWGQDIPGVPWGVFQPRCGDCLTRGIYLRCILQSVRI